MKKWAEICAVPLKSVVIERLLIEFLGTYEYGKNGATYYDYIVRDFLKFLKGKKNSIVYMPGINENINIGEDWLSKAETALAKGSKRM